MRWLHLSDIHVHGDESGSQVTAIRSLIDDISKELADAPRFDAVVLSGDVAQGGTATQYDVCEQILVRPLLAIGALRSAKLIVVPGNHDIDCDLVGPSPWQTLGPKRQAIYLEDSADGAKARRMRAAGFRAFADFIHRVGATAIDPTERLVQHFTLHTQAGPVHIVLCNTCMFADRETKDELLAPAPVPAIRTALSPLPKDPSRKIVVVGHYPIEWFLEDTQARLGALLDDHRALYVHGHTHRPSAGYGVHGIRALGLCAGFQAALDAAAKPYYRNSYAHCLWDDVGVHVLFRSWSSEYGHWIDETSVPSGFSTRSDALARAFVLPRHAEKVTRSTSATVPVERPPVSSRVRWAAGHDPEDYRRFVEMILELPADSRDWRTVSASPGLYIAHAPGPSGAHRYHLIAAPGHVLSKADVEAANNEIDYQRLARHTLVTLGDLSDDARASYDRLRGIKPLTIVTGPEVTQRLLKRVAHDLYSRVSKSAAPAELLYVGQDVGFLVAVWDEASARFDVLDPSGLHHDANDVVRSLLANIESARRRAPASGVVSGVDADPKEYAEACVSEFNQVRYAALAAIGLRPANLTLEDMYVEPDADLEDDAVSERAINQAIDDVLAGFNMPDGIRAHLEVQLRKMFTSGQSLDSGKARELYHRHGSIVLLGDPGSGKTFFAKHQVLAYARAFSASDRSWYSNHTPIFVSLSELAHEKDVDTASMPELMARLSTRRGMRITAAQVLTLLDSGQAALFFDGLDEVATLEQRSRCYQRVRDLFERHRVVGNRVILTSRPAAVGTLDIPEEWPVVTLRGLTDTEMRGLAERVLAARVTATAVHVPFGSIQLSDGDAALIDQLMSDCRTRPGIGRLARNPLLLTLLMMIYANSGRPSAKRHRVYQQAIQTLAGARSRELGHTVFSESDLRRILGAISLAVFRRGDGALPQVSEAAERVRATIDVSMQPDPREAGERLLDEIANATGIILVHRRADAPGGGNVTFMHHSFMEYFAAVALADSSGLRDELGSLVRSTRWREVLQLVGGLLAESGNLDLFVEGLLHSRRVSDPHTLRPFVTALECALENELPPFAVRQRLAAELARALKGPLKRDQELRARVASLVADLYGSGGRAEIDTVLVAALASIDEGEVAATIELTGRIATHSRLSAGVMDALTAALRAAASPVTVVAACEALAVSTDVREGFGDARQILQQALDGSQASRFAALRAAERVAELADSIRAELGRAVRDPAAYVGVRAAVAILRHHFELVDLGSTNAELFADAVDVVLRSGREADIKATELVVSRQTIDSLLATGNSRMKTLGVGLLTWLKGDVPYASGHLRAALYSEVNREECVAALGVLRAGRELRARLSIADVDHVIHLLNATTRDVRIAACRVLGTISGDETVCRSLIRYAVSRTEQSELGVAIHSLVGAGRGVGAAQAYVIGELTERLLGQTLRHGNTRLERARVLALLRAARLMEAPASEELARRLRGASESYKIPRDIQRASCAALGAVGEPNEDLFAWAIEMLSRRPLNLRSAASQMMAQLTARVKRRVEWIRAFYPFASKFREAISGVLVLTASEELNERAMRDFQLLRRSLDDIDDITAAYEEFAPHSLPGIA